MKGAFHFDGAALIFLQQADSQTQVPKPATVKDILENRDAFLRLCDGLSRKRRLEDMPAIFREGIEAVDAAIEKERREKRKRDLEAKEKERAAKAKEDAKRKKDDELRAAAEAQAKREAEEAAAKDAQRKAASEAQSEPKP